MATIYNNIDDDIAYLDFLQYNSMGDCVGYQRKVVMTRELFLQCYDKWVKGEPKEAADENSI